jgi:hypothetical protein
MEETEVNLEGLWGIQITLSNDSTCEASINLENYVPQRVIFIL